MERIELEVFAETTNAAVVKMPGRRVPGLVVQGDPLHNLLQQARSISKRAREHDDEELFGESESLANVLTELVGHYKRVLKSHGLELPFSE